MTRQSYQPQFVPVDWCVYKRTAPSTSVAIFISCFSDRKCLIKGSQLCCLWCMFYLCVENTRLEFVFWELQIIPLAGEMSYTALLPCIMYLFVASGGLGCITVLLQQFLTLLKNLSVPYIFIQKTFEISSSLEEEPRWI